MSRKAAVLAAERGYKNIQIYREGIKGWVRANKNLVKGDALPSYPIKKISAKKLKKMIKKVMVVDIRPEHLYKRGSVDNSLKIPMEELSTRYTEIPKSKKIVIVDHLEKQSHIANRFLKSKGFKGVSVLEGGLMPLILEGISL